MVLTYFLTIVPVLLSVLLGLIGCRKTDSTDDLFSKDYTTILKGICCIVVVMVHVHSEYGNVLQDAIGSFGYVCVTLFFMISAYGMQLSAENKPDYLKHFWRNRLLALLIPIVLINLCFYIIDWLLDGTASVKILIGVNHYVIALLEYCLWFFIVMWLKSRLKIQSTVVFDWLLVAGVFISSILFWFINSAGLENACTGWSVERLGLIWGLFLYHKLPQIKKWLTSNRGLKIAIFMMTSLLLGILYIKHKNIFFFGGYMLKGLLGLSIVVFILLLTVKRNFSSKPSIYLGKISYEIYLSHGMVMSVLAILLPNISSGVFIILTYVTTIILSSVIYVFSSRLIGLLRSK